MTLADAFPRARFSTVDLPERDRIAMWRDLYEHTIFRAEVRPDCDASFHATVISRALPDLHLRYGILSPVSVTRTRAYLGDGNDDHVLVINQAGSITATARGHEVALHEGDAVLVSSGDVSRFDRSTAGGSISMRIPRTVLSSRVVDIDDTVMRPIPRSAGVLRLLTGYTRPLLEDGPARPELWHLAVKHVHDLVALALGATREAAEVARSRGVRAARLRAAKSYIIENSGDPALSIGTVAEHLRVTPRYLQKLFDGEGGTFSDFVLAQRLVRAHRMLTDARYDSSQVSAIAYEAGFGDLSYFHRCFRKRYGATPRDTREGAAK
jgi:AraC-like DNA-binding protein